MALEFGRRGAEGFEATRFAEFNRSLMFFQPKKHCGLTEGGTQVFTTDCVRPLNVANTDNRLIANAVRARVEIFLGNQAARLQRGFLPGRSVLANLVDIDARMREEALGAVQAGAVLFDIAAVSPFLEHKHLHKASGHLGLPPWMLRSISVRYSHNHCLLVLGGLWHTGFCITRGVRQGCPLSFYCVREQRTSSSAD